MVEYADPSYIPNLPPDAPSLTDQPDLSGLQNIETPEPATLENLMIKAARNAEIDREIATYEALIAQLKIDKEEIEEKHVPQIMEKLNMLDFSLKDGTVIELELKFQGGIVVKDKEQRKKQLDWLAEKKTGGESLIKKEFSLTFVRGKSKEADALQKILDELGFKYSIDESVHAGSLGAFIKEKVRKGDEVPFDDLKWRCYQRAKFKEPKEK